MSSRHDAQPVSRRHVLTALGAGAAAVGLAACSRVPDGTTRPADSLAGEPRSVPQRLLPAPHPTTRVLKVYNTPPKYRQIIWSVDDGAREQTLAAYLDWAGRSGTHLVLCPVPGNPSWEQHADTLVDLVARGQVQIVNHSMAHRDLTAMSDDQIRADLQAAERWINETFGVTSRPWLRPPLGRWDKRTEAVFGELGYGRVLIWNSSLDDAWPRTSAQVLAAADAALKPTAIVLAHANQSAVIDVLDDIEQLMAQRSLVPCTLDQVFGTSRAVG